MFLHHRAGAISDAICSFPYLNAHDKLSVGNQLAKDAKSSLPMKQAAETSTIPDALTQHATQKGISLAALSDQSPLLLVFLRQFG